jgi:chromosomal replication initiation ATPase DnaA
MAEKATQLALDLRHRAAMGREDFLVSPSNEEAVAWIDRWPDWPGHALVLIGPPGCGKTHLGQVWQAQAGAQPYRADLLSATAGPNTSVFAPVFVDDADAPGRDEELFHLFNAAGAAGSFVLFASHTAPARWENRLPDLKSRLAAAPNIQIQSPDTPLIAAVMLKMFADEQMDVGADVLEYLVNRMERSFEAARTLAERLNNASLATRRGITVPLAREVFDALESDSEV